MSAPILSPSRRAQSAFTLVELLVVIAIIGTLVALLLPAVQAARESARRMQCSNQMRQVVLAAHNYQGSISRFPSHGDPDPKLSALALLLPYFEEQAVLDLVRTDLDWRDQRNDPALRTPMPFLRCPSGTVQEPSYVNTDEVLVRNWRDDGVMGINSLQSHYVGNMGARPEICNAGGGGGGRGGGGSSWHTEEPYASYVQSQVLFGGTSSCPDGGFTASSGGAAVNGVIFPLSRLDFGDITDGSSHTIMFGELSWEVDIEGRTSEPSPFAPWLVGSTSLAGNDPEQQRQAAFGFVQNAKNVRYGLNQRRLVDTDGRPASHLTDVSFGSNHSGGGAQLGMCDGSTHFVSDDIDPDVLRAMASRQAED